MSEAPSLRRSSSLADHLASEMAAAWRRGEKLPAEHYLEHAPDLADNSEAAVRLVYEEVCLRQEAGEEVAAEELARRFPRWAAEIAVVLDCHRLMRQRPGTPAFPEPGEALGDFRLLAELGRGGHGRVYLATQTGLADRPVVLKVSPRRAQEHLALARLQHTHVIPLHALYDFPERELRALCLPYLGGATLAAILERLTRESVLPRRGVALLEALDALQDGAPVRLPRAGAFRRLFERSGYVEAIVHIGVCLADALHHAHERGLVHLDLKPGNVLLAADAQPLLLDFHLARRSLPAGRLAPDGLGGTPGHMAPEQERAVEVASRGQAVPEAVDHRADIFALGRLLQIALGGKQPLHRHNPEVSVGLSDIVERCLAERPEERYPDAAALAADLRRHRAGLPLIGVPNRSWRERWQKWRRRRPRALLGASLTLAFVAAGTTLAAGAVGRYLDARDGLAHGEHLLRQDMPDEAVRALRHAREQAEWLPGAASLRADVNQRLRQASRAEAAAELHALAERLRFHAGDEHPSPEELKLREQARRVAEEKRPLLTEREVAPLPDVRQERLQADLLDIFFLAAEAQQQRDGGPGRRHESVRAALAEAEQWLGAAVPPERRAYWEHLALGQELLRSGEPGAAAAELERAAELRPQDFWVAFYQGVCAYRRGRFDEAAQAFRVAVALAPDCAEGYYNRGLANAAAKRPEAALRDYDRALALAPGLGAAALNRGVLHYEAGHLAEARADLERALRAGADPAAVHYNIALVCLHSQDATAARSHVERALEHDPGHAAARALRDRLRPRP